MNAFEILGIGKRLVIADEDLREAFREAGKSQHPDAGGEEGEFATLREAFAILSSPSKRLKHWLELKGLPVVPRGTITPSLMELFSEVGTATQKAEALIRERDQAKSSLVHAMLEGRAQQCRDEVETLIEKLEIRISGECGVFPAWESEPDPDPVDASRVVRDLAFLEKWRAGLRGCFSRLI